MTIAEVAALNPSLDAAAVTAELTRRFGGTVESKLAGHGIDDPSFVQPDRPMSAIGG